MAPVIATAVALTLYFTLLRYNDVEAELRQRGFAMTRQLVAATQYGLFSGNINELNRLTRILKREPDVSAITIYDQHNRPLAASGTPFASPQPSGLMDGWNGEDKNGNILSFHNKVFASSLPLVDPYSVKSSKPSPNLLLGSITVELSRNNLVARKREILLFTVCAALFILLVAGLIARRLGRDISEPVLALEDTVNKIREGLLNSRVSPHPAGTLRMLEEGINAMATVLEQVQKHSEEALISSNTQLQRQSNFAGALLEAQANAGICLFIIDDWQIIFANKAALDFSGRSREELEHMNVSDVVVQQDRGELNRHYQRVLRGEALTSRIEVNLDTQDGTERWTEIVTFTIPRDNKHLVAMLGVDTTQRKRDARQLLKAHDILRVQKEEAERSNTAKSRFLAAASHDLRQPLHALKLFSEQLQEHVTTPTQSSLADQIDAAINNMSGLLESILDISKIDLAAAQPNICEIELGPLLDRVVALHQHAAENKQLRLSVGRTSLRILSDPDYLSRIVSNLLSNALRYTGQGAILIGARHTGNNIRIEIWDTGIGIKEEHLPLLFQEFYQVDNPERDARKGLGLGLAIAHRLAGKLGHKISVRSKPGVGSVFTVLVPRAKAEDMLCDSSTAKTPSARILLVLDNEAQQTGLALMLENWGYSVRNCQASEVAQALESGETLPDLIMCGQSSIGQIDQSLMTPTVNEVPLIGITDGTEPSDSEWFRGTYYPLAAPVKPSRLRALILHLLTERKYAKA
ncbi:MAG: ATP-binding protein [Georgfuchsia sp.]